VRTSAVSQKIYRGCQPARGTPVISLWVAPQESRTNRGAHRMWCGLLATWTTRTSSGDRDVARRNCAETRQTGPPEVTHTSDGARFVAVRYSDGCTGARDVAQVAPGRYEP
jgi:hypothetical protein